MWKWESGEYPVWFRERVVAWYGLHALVRAHQEDAALEDSNKKAKK